MELDKEKRRHLVWKPGLNAQHSLPLRQTMPPRSEFPHISIKDFDAHVIDGDSFPKDRGL